MEWQQFARELLALAVMVPMSVLVVLGVVRLAYVFWVEVHNCRKRGQRNAILRRLNRLDRQNRRRRDDTY